MLKCCPLGLTPFNHFPFWPLIIRLFPLRLFHSHHPFSSSSFVAPTFLPLAFTQSISILHGTDTVLSFFDLIPSVSRLRSARTRSDVM